MITMRGIRLGSPSPASHIVDSHAVTTEECVAAGCEQCDRVYDGAFNVLVNQNNLRQHERSVHPVGVTCDQCGRVSGSEQSVHVVACRSINDVVRASCESPPPGLDRVLP
jgi:hypothetical protein